MLPPARAGVGAVCDPPPSRQAIPFIVRRRQPQGPRPFINGAGSKHDKHIGQVRNRAVVVGELVARGDKRSICCAQLEHCLS